MLTGELMLLSSEEPMSNGLMSMKSHQGVTPSPVPEGPRQTLLGGRLNLWRVHNLGHRVSLIYFKYYSLNLNYAFYSWGPIIRAHFKFKSWPPQRLSLPREFNGSVPHGLVLYRMVPRFSE